MRKSKRGLLSLLLTLAMVLTMLPTTALAVDVAPVDTAPTDTAAAPAEPETAPAPEETPEEPAPDAGADADVDANADEPAEAPEKPAETPEAPAEDTDAPAGDEAPAPEETTPPADADTGADAEAPEAPEEPAGQPEETPAPEEEPKDEEPDGVTAPAADKVLDSGPIVFEATVEVPEDLIPDEDMFPDNDELFAAYVEKTFYEKVDDSTFNDAATYGSIAGDRLSAAEKAMYDRLKPWLTKIADGQESSTIYSIDINLTPANMGFGTITSQEQADKFFAAVNAKLKEYLVTSTTFHALLADCPYELYWFDKVSGMKSFYSNTDGSISTVTGFQATLNHRWQVAKEYQGANYNEEAPTVNTSITSAAKTSAQNAVNIVTENAGKNDFEKLLAYKNKIAELTDYNFEALKPETPYGNPWQLIWVFDGKAETKVVCEGYAKAFQYLCDLTTTFENEIVCYTVTGDMDGGTGAGGHMWNVVKMEDGKNYLVDVTNCDQGSIGYPDDLFLAGIASSDGGKTYTFPIKNAKIKFIYDDDQKDLHVPGWLVLANTYYTPTNRPVLTATSAVAANKTFDGTKVGEVTSVSFKNTEDNSVVNLKLGIDYDAVSMYTSPNAGTNTAKVLVALLNRQYKLAGADDEGIVEIPTTNVTAPAIAKANANFKVEVSPNQQKAGKAVTVKVTARHPLYANDYAQPKQNTIVVTPVVTLAPVAGEDNIGIYSGTYNIDKTATPGIVEFTATLGDTNFASTPVKATLTVTEKGIVDVKLTADKTAVTYGDTVTVTASAAKQDANDTDPLAGTLTLYLGDKAISEPLNDLTKEITVTLDKAKLTAGTHTLKAVFTSGNEFFANNDNTTQNITVAQKTLTWNTSAITVAVRSDAEEDAFANPPVQGKLAIDGVLEGDKVEFTYTGLTAPAMTKTPAEQKLNLTVTGAAISGDSVANYKLPDTDPEVIATVNEINEIKNPEEGEKRIEPEKELPEGAELKLVVETGISTPIAGKTPADIIGDLKTKIQETIKDLTGKFAAYDVALLYKAPGSDKWVPADEEEHFPVTIVLPYPAATNYNYTVSHMKKDGTVEALSAENVKDGLRIKVTSLSPIGIAWTEPTYSGGGGGGGNYSGDVWEKIEKAIEEADKGDRIEAKVYDENMPVSTMQALYDDGGVTLVIKWNGEDIIIPAGKALNPSTEAGRIYYPLSYLAELYKGSKIPTGNAGNPETGGVWVITAPTYSTPIPAPTEPVPVPQAVVPPPAPPGPKGPETPTATAPVQPEEPVNSSSKVGTIVALLALMAAAAAGAYFLYKKRDDDGLYTK